MTWIHVNFGNYRQNGENNCAFQQFKMGALALEWHSWLQGILTVTSSHADHFPWKLWEWYANSNGAGIYPFCSPGFTQTLTPTDRIICHMKKSPDRIPKILPSSPLPSTLQPFNPSTLHHRPPRSRPRRFLDESRLHRLLLEEARVHGHLLDPRTAQGGHGNGGGHLVSTEVNRDQRGKFEATHLEVQPPIIFKREMVFVSGTLKLCIGLNCQNMSNASHPFQVGMWSTNMTAKQICGARAWGYWTWVTLS